MASGSSQSLRRAEELDAPELRALLNAAYADLALAGRNYTASYQDVGETLAQITSRRVFVHDDDDGLAGTISVREENWFTGRRTAYIGKVAVRPDSKRKGLGGAMMDFVESLAAQEGFDGVQLDTAKPVDHLVAWYVRRGYRIVGETPLRGKDVRFLDLRKRPPGHRLLTGSRFTKHALGS